MSNFSYPINISQNGLVGRWDLDGNAIDSSGNGNDGTATDVTWVKSEKGFTKEVGSFNGSSSSIDNGGKIYDFTNSIYISCWIKQDANSGHSAIFSQGDSSDDENIKLKVGSDQLYFEIRHGGTAYYTDAGDIIEDGNYHFLEGIWDGNEIKIYVDNVLINTTTASFTLGVTLDQSYIGAYKSGNGADFWNDYLGNIGLVRVYSRVLSENERRTLYLEGKRKFGDGLLQQYPELFEGCVVYYDFKGDASNLIDGTVATVNGATLTTDHLGNEASAYSFNNNGDDRGNYIFVNDFYQKYNISSNTIPHSFMSIFKYVSQSDSNEDMFIGLDLSGDDWNNSTSYSGGSRFDIYILANGDIRLKSWDGNNDFTFTPSIDILDGFYHTLFVTCNNINTYFYIDGNIETQIDYNRFNDGGSYYDLFIGKHPYHITNNNSTKSLEISECLFYQKYLSASQIKQLYQLTSKKYIYQYAKWSPSSLPKPILHINGNRSGDTFFDVSGNGNHGTQSGGVTSGRIGQSKWMGFDGSDDTIKNDNFVNIGNYSTCTFSLIVKTTTTSTFKLIGFDDDGGDNDMAIEIDNGTDLDYYFRTNLNTETVADVFLNDGKRHHYVVQFDNNGNKTYIDGLLVNTSTQTLSNTSTILNIGNVVDVNGNSSRFDGELGDVYIFNQALTQSQIQQLYYSNYN